MDFYIESARFKDGKIHDSKGVDTLKFKRINVFIGANNSGKTQILKDLIKNLGVDKNKENILLDRNKTKFIYPNDGETFVRKCHLKRDETEREYYFSYMSAKFENDAAVNATGRGVEKKRFRESFADDKKFNSLINDIGPSVCTYLTSDKRLQLIKPVSSVHTSPISVYDGILFSNESDTIIETISDWFYKIFNVHTWLTNNSYGGILFRYNLTKSEVEKAGLTAKQKEIDKRYKPVDDQGDGMRALLGILCGIFCNKKPIIFIDEPEAYLHPGQAYLLGRFMRDMVDGNRQVFISTHSADFLRGIFFSAYDDVAVTRLYRHMDDTVDCYQLDNQKLEEISKDNVSSTYNILDGLFHPACVVCEGDKDVLIYQSMFDKISPTSDIHVFPTTGMGGVANATDLYRTMNIKHAIILDCDCLLNTNPTNQDLNCPVVGVFNKYVSDLDIKKQLNDLLSQLNSAFTIVYDPNTGNPKGIDKDERNKFKSSLKDCLKEKGMEQCFDDINKLVNTYGIFITQEGQLEAWFKGDVSINTNFKENDSKQERYEKIVNSLYSKPDDELINTELGKFIGSIVKYFD